MVGDEVTVKIQRHPHLPYRYESIPMKKMMWRSGFLCILSGVVGCLLSTVSGFSIMVPFLLGKHVIGIRPEIYLGEIIFAHETVLYIWLPVILAGSVTGVITGIFVIYYPKFVNQLAMWAFIGGLTTVSALFLCAPTLSREVQTTSFFIIFPLVFFILGCIGGLVARFVYGMLQRRFLPELQMN